LCQITFIQFIQSGLHSIQGLHFISSCIS